MRYVFVAIATLSAGYASLGQAVSPPNPATYLKEALVWEHYDTTVHMRADGTGDLTNHITARLQSEGAVRLFSVISVSFAASEQTASIDYIRVHKSDGTTVETPVADAMEMPAPVTTTAPLYSDLKQKQLPVRSLAVGDVLEYQFHTVTTKPAAPGQFWGMEHFLRDGGVVLSQTLTLEVPAGVYVQVWSPNHPATPRQHDGVRTYTWSVSQLQTAGKAAAAEPVTKIDDPDEDADGRKLPSVAWTTFHSWPELGNWYRSLALSRAQPTPAIVARATELTKDAKTPEEQMRALYQFVSTRIRYVGIDFGIGRFQPHTADEVLAYQYGDCKDKDTLFEALLRAKGFTPAPALIGVGIAPVPSLPSPALFNHVITTVQLAGKPIWLDATPGAAPFQVLIAPIRDQQALVIPATAAASLERTPASPPYPYFERFEASGSLSKDGLLTSHMAMTLRSDNELGFRALLQQLAPAQWDEAMQSISRALGFGGTVSHTDLTQKDPAGPVQLSYDYSRPSFADWEHHRILPLFPVLEVTLVDQEKAPEHDIDQGAPRTLEAVTRIRLPQGYEPDLLTPVHVVRSYALFDQTYRQQGDELVIERKLVVLKQKVPKAEWKDYYAYTRALGAESGENYISLRAPGEKGSNAALDKARDAMLQGDWAGARQILDELKAADPKAPYVLSMLAGVDYHEGKVDEAIAELNTELANHPDASAGVVVQLASCYFTQKRWSDATTLLRGYISRDDLQLYQALAFAEIRSGNDAAATKTLQGALAKHPNEFVLESMLVSVLHRSHRDDEAVVMIKQALARIDDAKSPPANGYSDANTLNDYAYLLVEMKRELPLAERSSRRSVSMLESALATVPLAGATDYTYRQTNLLIAAWDTLGWILFAEGKPAEAEPYLRAAWVNHASVVIGDHLAQTLEALGRPAEAAAIDELALAAEGATNDSETKAEVTKHLHGLREAGTKGATGDPTQTLQQMRTFHLPKAPGVKGSGTLALAISANQVVDSQLRQGPETLRPLQAKVNGLKNSWRRSRQFRGSSLSRCHRLLLCNGEHVRSGISAARIRAEEIAGEAG